MLEKKKNTLATPLLYIQRSGRLPFTEYTWLCLDTNMSDFLKSFGIKTAPLSLSRKLARNVQKLRQWYELSFLLGKPSLFLSKYG